MNKSLPVVLAVALLCAGTAQAKKKFVIDHQGAKPCNYRITAMCQFYHSRIVPRAFRTSIFNKVGKNLKAGLVFGVGDEGGKPLLLRRTWRSDSNDITYEIIGDASSLDNMLPLPGIKIHGYQVWDTLALVWRSKCEVEPGMNLKRFTGTLLGYEQAMGRLLANVASLGKTETAANMRVLVSFYTQHWWHLIPSGHMPDPTVPIEKAKSLYFTPLSEAAAGYNAAQKKALAAVNEAVIEGLEDLMDHWNHPDFDWVSQAKKDVLVKLLAMLNELQGQLEQ